MAVGRVLLLVLWLSLAALALLLYKSIARRVAAAAAAAAETAVAAGQKKLRGKKLSTPAQGAFKQKNTAQPSEVVVHQTAVTTDQPAGNESCCQTEAGSSTCACKQQEAVAEAPPAGGLVIYATQSGGAKKYALQLAAKARALKLGMKVTSASVFEPEDLPKEKLLVVVASTYSDGSPPENASFFYRWLEESATDFRVGSGLLQGTTFACFGLGSRAYQLHYNTVARSIDKWLSKLGAKRLLRMGEGDEDGGRMDEEFQDWCASLLSTLGHTQPIPDPAQLVQDDGSSDIGDEDAEDQHDVVDMEDIAGKSTEPMRTASKEMVTPIVRAALTKQGYKIVGSHSGVKLCRWTKAQLRGRGGCYKHSFYGIESHRCMEATPSLACANKCVFCWRHHSNPVGTSWKWAMDPPDAIVEGALSHHKRMIAEMRGVPGVKPERLEEGLNPRHCALSLVGEPIMYPEINELVGMLHDRRISTFLVTNAQFPDRIQQLSPVTQLYVSVDAATQDSLKAIDRPLFKDFWERFQSCLQLLHLKRQRTVYRLTLVKGYNMEEVNNYASLVALGQPDFIEIKGVTFCGSTNTSDLTMQNVPWHEEVRRFSDALCRACGDVYGLACEHEHSCCVLLANKNKFLKNGEWHTWIDYEQFHDLVKSGVDFGSEDYMAPTPSWAVFGAEEAGFDPKETRERKVRRHKDKT
eukprot:jgi/Chlat1/4968/Chrsp32S04948